MKRLFINMSMWKYLFLFFFLAIKGCGGSATPTPSQLPVSIESMGSMVSFEAVTAEVMPAVNSNSVAASVSAGINAKADLPENCTSASEDLTCQIYLKIAQGEDAKNAYGQDNLYYHLESVDETLSSHYNAFFNADICNGMSTEETLVTEVGPTTYYDDCYALLDSDAEPLNTAKITSPYFGTYDGYCPAGAAALSADCYYDAAVTDYFETDGRRYSTNVAFKQVDTDGDTSASEQTYVVRSIRNSVENDSSNTFAGIINSTTGEITFKWANAVDYTVAWYEGSSEGVFSERWEVTGNTNTNKFTMKYSNALITGSSYTHMAGFGISAGSGNSFLIKAQTSIGGNENIRYFCYDASTMVVTELGTSVPSDSACYTYSSTVGAMEFFDLTNDLPQSVFDITFGLE